MPPNALTGWSEVALRLAGRPPAVFLDYDGTLTPIVERPMDARLSATMREVIEELARRCPVCIVSGRDRSVVQELMGVRDLTVAGSHGFDIWHPEGREIPELVGAPERELIQAVTRELQAGVSGLAGVEVEPKAISVAVHDRRAGGAERRAAEALVAGVLAAHPGRLKVTPGRHVREVQPNLDWDKGRAVLHLLRALGLDGPDVLPIYVGDDVTDEDAFRAVQGRGIGILVTSEERGHEPTSATFSLRDT
ncbi:MAG: trehalose-phosphatase, partial [Candidatus Dormiibacterota bacterium]